MANDETPLPIIPAVSTLAAADVDMLKVAELMIELKKHNQSVRGNTPELKKRLLVALTNNAPLVVNQMRVCWIIRPVRHLIITHIGSRLATRITKTLLIKWPRC